MGATIIAVLGTLAGALISGLLQHQVTVRSDRAKQAEQLRRDRLEAITALAEAATNHRRTMYTRFNLEQAGADADRLEAAKAESYLTRSAIARPAVTFRLLVDDAALRQLGHELVSTTYGLRDAATQTELDDSRRASLAAHDAFVDAAREYLTA